MKFPSSHKKVWLLAGPLIISNISIAVLGMVDTAIVGHLNKPYYLGAVAVGAVIFDFLYWGMGFLRMGTTGVVAQIHGKNDNDQIRSTLVHAIAIALFFALLFLLMQLPISKVGLFLIGGSEQVTHYARIYFNWTIWGAPAVLCSMAVMGWLLGMQNAKATLIIAITTNIINVVLDFFFVFGLNMDVRGVAIASVIAQYAGLFLGGILVYRELIKHPGQWRCATILNKERFSSILVLNQNIFIRTICLIFAFAFFTRQGAVQSDLILAANTILLNFLFLLSMALDGFANAVEAIIGKAIGGRDRQAFKEAIRVAVFWSAVVAVIFSLLYGLMGKQLVNIMTDIDSIRMTTYEFLPWIIIFPLINVWCYFLDGIFFGATKGREMRDMMIISTFFIYLPAWYLFQFMGNHGLWLAFSCFFVARGVCLGIAYFRIEKYEGGFIPQAA